MNPSDWEFDHLASRLSDEISTVEQQLEELGAAVFTTAQLIELRGRFWERLDNLAFFQKKLTRLAVGSPLLLLLGGGLFWTGFYRLGMFLMMAFPVALVVCLAGVFLQYQNFGSRGRIESWLELVNAELKKRKAGNN